MTRTALVVGINTYTHFSPLTAPATDAEAIAQRLEADGEFQVMRLPEVLSQTEGETRATVGQTQAISQTMLETALRQLFRPNSPQHPDTALFYFSGHGLRDPDGPEGLDKGYLATSDTNPQQARPGLSLAWLQNLLAHSPIPNQIVWLDCCHSGGLLIDVAAANPGHSTRRNRCFIASSRDYEQSWQDLNSPYSVLTKALLDGLDPARLPERWIDSFALVDYVNQALQGELQSPVCTNFGDAINLTRTWQAQTVAPAVPTADSGLCPYKGLEYFDLNDDDPKLFFGREALTGQLLDHVRTHNFMALVGASGNGKSSVLRAGLLHQLRLGRRIAGSEQWQILITRPDDAPLKNLALAFLPEGGSQIDRAEALGRAEGLLKEGGPGLARLVDSAEAPRVVLVVDQFEEVFTRCQDADPRQRYFDCLMGALSDKLCLILAMRADFVGKCLEQDYGGLAQRVQAGMVSVLPLTPVELEAAICQPAQQAGLTVEPSLVQEMIADIQGAPGSLPLLQYTLKVLWQQRQGNALTLATYLELGRINGTLDQRATAVYEGFDAAQQQTVQHIFQQLTQLGEGTEDTRRRVFLDNLVAEPRHPAQQVTQVIETLANEHNRLLVTNEVVGKGAGAQRRAIVDVAHEALIRHWRLLRGWIEQNRDVLRQQRRIEASAVTWQEHQQARGYLLQGFPLKEALRFQQDHAERFPFSDPAQEYIQKSLRQRWWSRAKVASWLIIPATLVVGVVEFDMRERRVDIDIARIQDEQTSKVEERYAVEDLVRGCKRGVPLPEENRLGNYLGERLLWGNCRSLARFDFSAADLIDANLRSADLIDANLRFAKLVNANLSNTNLSAADLSFAILFAADLSNTNLSFADLSSADLGNTNLRDANLRNANLRDANLRDANFSSADLSSADLSNTNLRDANLSSADLSSANLSSARNLTKEQVTQAQLCRTQLPIRLDLGSNRDCEALSIDPETGEWIAP